MARKTKEQILSQKVISVCNRNFMERGAKAFLQGIKTA